MFQILLVVLYNALTYMKGLTDLDGLNGRYYV